MKRILLTLTLLVILFSGCSKISGLSPYKDNNMSFVIAGKTYVAKVISITVNNEFVVINVTADDDIFLAISLKGSPKVGPYNFSKKEEAEATISIKQGVQTNLFSTSLFEGSGSFYMSNLDCDKKLASGSFYFTGTYKKLPEDELVPIEVEQGYFQNVKYVGNYTCPEPPEEEEEEEE